MKITILIALGAVAALAGAANAQTADNKTGKVQLKDIPNIGPLFRAPITPAPSDEHSLFGPDMPPAPKMPQAPTQMASNAKLKISVLKSSKGEIFQIEAAGQSRAAILKKITDVMGVRAVIDPSLEKNFVITQVFRGLSWDDLLASVNYGIEMVKSPSGTYFFADKPFGLAFNFPSDYSSQHGDSFVESEQSAENSDPFNAYRAPTKRADPQPNWQKREFNGREFYYIPAPAIGKSPESPKSK